MLDRLLETGVQRRKSRWGGMVSVIVHAAVIGLAIVRTGTAKPERAGPERIYFPIVAPRSPAPTGPVSSGAGHSTTGAPPTIPHIPLPGPVDLDIPTQVPGGPAGADSVVLSDIVDSGGSGGTNVMPSDGVAGSDVVDSPVRVLSERVPLYPEALRSAGIAGTVTMQFVIDTLGRVEPSSLRVLASNHELFTRSVVASLREARFTPGEVAGRRVRTLVERSFRFDIAGAR